MIIDINKGLICQYCNAPTEYVDSNEVYRKSYGMIYLCRGCAAWVGVHKGTSIALGRVANEELRYAKKEAHFWFDGLWKHKIKGGESKHSARSGAYKWLAKAMNVEPELCHIGMFTTEQCEEVVELCKKYYPQKN